MWCSLRVGLTDTHHHVCERKPPVPVFGLWKEEQDQEQQVKSVLLLSVDVEIALQTAQVLCMTVSQGHKLTKDRSVSGFLFQLSPHSIMFSFFQVSPIIFLFSWPETGWFHFHASVNIVVFTVLHLYKVELSDTVVSVSVRGKLRVKYCFFLLYPRVCYPCVFIVTLTMKVLVTCAPEKPVGHMMTHLQLIIGTVQITYSYFLVFGRDM